MIVEETDKNTHCSRPIERCSRCKRLFERSDPVLPLRTIDGETWWYFCQACVKAEQEERDTKIVAQLIARSGAAMRPRHMDMRHEDFHYDIGDLIKTCSRCGREFRRHPNERLRLERKGWACTAYCVDCARNAGIDD